MYPRQSSNGSTVIVYGQELGLRVVWYSGKSFKSRKEAAHSAVNGTTKSDPMVIDLDDDDDGPTAEPHAAPAEFEQEEDEVDPSAPYRDVLRYIDIPLGTAASRIAIPHPGKDLAQGPSASWPPIYNDRIVVASACTDLTIRVISVPLDPPAPDVHDISRMGVQVVKIEGANSHQQFISDISITHTGDFAVDQDEAEAQAQAQTQTQTRSNSQPKQEAAESDSVQWSLLLASLSGTGSGLLLVHQLPLRGVQIASGPEYFSPLRRTYLRSSSMGAKLSFNPSPFPAERHSTLLITLPSDSTAKVYQIFSTHNRERRGSSATTDSTSTTRSMRHFSAERGRFLMTFLSPFSQNDTRIGQRRKRILDAKWVVCGRAVVALLEDGGWGIWDLEAVGPTSSTLGPNLIRGQGNISGIHGGSLTRFSARSKVVPVVETKTGSSNSQPQPTSGSLAPMTPSTRKVRSEGLFQGSKINSAATTPSTPQHGMIYVKEQSSNRPAHDESVIISYGDENIYLPSILSFWKGGTTPSRLPSMRLGGQMLRSISLLPTTASPENPFSATGIFVNNPSTPNFLIQTSHRLIFSMNPLSSRPGTADASTQTAHPPSDLTLLASGDLDVEGMDRLLDDMGDGEASRKPMNLFNKSVGFRIHDENGDDDGDIDMTASPTPARARGLKSTNARGGSGTGLGVGAGATPGPKRRIFS